MSKIVLSFDDGRRDNIRVANGILIKYNIPATFNITTGYINKNIPKSKMPCPHIAMSIEELNEISNNRLFEIAGHGVEHNNSIVNLVDSVITLRKMLPNAANPIVGVASPHSEFDLTLLETAKVKFTDAKIDYLRVSNDYNIMGKTKIWLRRINRILNIPQVYYYTNKNSIILNKGSFLLHSIPVIRDNTLQELEYFIKTSLKDYACVFMFHSILKPGEDYYNDLFTWDYDRFEKFCVILNEYRERGLIEIETTGNLCK